MQGDIMIWLLIKSSIYLRYGFWTYLCIFKDKDICRNVAKLRAQCHHIRCHQGIWPDRRNEPFSAELRSVQETSNELVAHFNSFFVNQKPHIFRAPSRRPTFYTSFPSFAATTIKCLFSTITVQTISTLRWYSSFSKCRWTRFLMC